MAIDVDIQIICEAPDLPKPADIAMWATNALEEQIQQASLSIRVVDAQESQHLNNEYRNKDKPTNVLSFPFDAPLGVPSDAYEHLIGDLVICAPVVAEEARQQGKPLNHHWAHMVTHGALHLLGFDHISDDQAQVMEQLERKLLANIGIPNPYKDESEV